MITLYSLKNQDQFRLCYKTPYYIKNICLLLLEALVLLVIYFIYFRGDGSIDGAIKLFYGLDSHTFNFLTRNRKELNVGTKLQEFKFDKGKKINSVTFFS